MKVVLLLMLAAGSGAMELTKETWDEQTAGKTVFVKFQAPWCGHCKSMKPDWDKLMEEWADSKDALIADVDCTAGGKALCEEVGVQGFPTIKHGDPNNLEDYEGGRDFKALATFAKENLGPKCGPGNLDLCDAESKTTVEKFMKMDLAELSKLAEEKTEAMAKVDKDLEEFLKSLQSQYEAAQKKQEADKKAIKDSGLGLMKSVAAHRKSPKSEL